MDAVGTVKWFNDAKGHFLKPLAQPAMACEGA